MALTMNLNLPAITIKSIDGSAIKTIPIGTKFILQHGDPQKFCIGHEYSFCIGLEISMIWNDEFKILENNS
jgi:hypothetical protein